MIRELSEASLVSILHDCELEGNTNTKKYAVDEYEDNPIQFSCLELHHGHHHKGEHQADTESCGQNQGHLVAN